MLRASSNRYQGTSIMTHRQLLASLLLVATAAPAQAVVTDASLDAATAAVMPQVITWRRDFHQNPELSNREFRTSGKVAEKLKALGLEVKTGIAHTGVVGILRGGRPGPAIALRADMDGLPVTEQADLPFKSTATAEYRGEKVGVMHACGHDAHTAILMGVAAWLAARSCRARPVRVPAGGRGCADGAWRRQLMLRRPFQDGSRRTRPARGRRAPA
jgi:hypothetical protein